jgi:hypothetical protein
MRRSFGFDVLACPRCGDRLELIALIDNPSVIRRILSHLGLPTEVPAARPARPPPLPRATGYVGRRRRRSLTPHEQTDLLMPFRPACQETCVRPEAFDRRVRRGAMIRAVLRAIRAVQGRVGGGSHKGHSVNFPANASS